ncbi:MAG: DNA polymerase IV [Actinomycetota bacterium]|nr:DNA polymerase IV [Actinomycetota bacterium]
MLQDSTILHADLDAFYASVEKRDDPRLYRRPVIVGAGVVLAASYEAKRCGVRTAMGVARAKRLCPYSVVVAPRFSAYVEASRAVFAVFEQISPVVEGLSIDEAFLDVRGLERISGSPTATAQRLRSQVRMQVGLPITVGVARTKFLAKVASAVAKPDGLLVVAPDEELSFLQPLPVERLWGVGSVTAAKLHKEGIRTVAQVAERDEAELTALLGRASGRHLHALAHNRDPRPVQARRRRRSIGSQRALGRRPRSAEELAVVLTGLVDRVTRRLRRAERSCRTVILRLRFGDFSRATRSRTLAEPTARTYAILSLTIELLEEAGPMITRRGITLIGVALTNLTEARHRQLALDLDRRGELDAVLDRLRDRFGAEVITRAALVGRDPGLSAPLLPD